jgi:hemerythrin-like domain-containing protein
MNAVPALATPSLDDIKSRILSDHREIRALLDEVANLTASISLSKEPASAVGQLTDPIWRLFLFFDEHLVYEERRLVPLLLETHDWGTIRAKRLKDEHHAQREVLRAMIKEFDGRTKSTERLLDDARWLVDSFRQDMTAEENELETIRDDGFVAGQCTG